LDGLPYLEQVGNITDSESRPPPPPLPLNEIYHGAGTPLIYYIPEPWKRNAQGYLETNQQNLPYYPFVTREEYKYIQCGIKKIDIKTYYDNMLQEENTAVCVPRFKNSNGIQKLIDNMPDDQALRGVGTTHSRGYDTE
jgi:hypothetical protein